jgi:NADPH:quinone reductase-like Zn-dependent oxidoreductase
LGAGRDGGYAEYVNVPAINCLPIPKGLNFHEAASIPLTFLTAWHMLMTRVELKYNEVVLVVGGGSGVGSAAIQIAKLKNSLVIATAGNEEKLQKAKALGADFCINHHEANLVEEVKKLTNKRGVDVVFEHVGGAVFEDCLQILAQGGRLVTCGATIGSEAKIEITRMFMKHQAIYGSIMGTKAELVELLPLFDNSSLKPVVDKVFPLSEAKNAHQYMEAGKHFGKIILDPTL